jgi:riboflavin kinase/FMN adenylyltransferase
MLSICNENCVDDIRCSVVSVGNFDGIHRGHRILFDALRQRAHELSAVSAIITFEPHTRAVLSPGHIQPILSTFEEKALILKESGIDYLVRLPFNAWYKQLSPSTFIDEVLIKRYRAVEWVMGENHTFGKNQAGNTKFLHQSGGENHFNMFIISLQTDHSAIISSTTIRTRIVEGEMDEAVSMLGHPYLIFAERVEGVKKGMELGFPTLNFKTPRTEKVIPPPGVYAAELEFQNQHMQGALYFGNCPTFGNRDYHFEFHAFTLTQDAPAPHQTGALWLHRFIRPDATFASADELVHQMKQDISTIQTFFSQE